MDINKIKTSIIGIVGLIGSVAAHFLGGWNMALQTLIIFMGIDYLTVLLVAGVFHKSEKSDTGALESRAGWKGLCRKGMTLLIVLVATQLDKVAGTDVIRNAVIIAYVVNETISIIENAGLMGLPIPSIIRKALDLLSKQAEESEFE